MRVNRPGEELAEATIFYTSKGRLQYLLFLLVSNPADLPESTTRHPGSPGYHRKLRPTSEASY